MNLSAGLWRREREGEKVVDDEPSTEAGEELKDGVI